jgi:hypothetical protein
MYFFLRNVGRLLLKLLLWFNFRNVNLKCVGKINFTNGSNRI